MAKTIAIQGGYGAFHEIAAHHYFAGEEINILPRKTFRDMVTTLKDRECDFGIMAIENSLAGSIIPRGFTNHFNTNIGLLRFKIYW